jgi:O-methyltransferase
VDRKIELKLQPANLTLQELLDDGEAGQYDMAFIDADKTGYADYYETLLTLLRPGGLLLADNTLWSGRVADDSDQEEDTLALRAFNVKLHKDERVDLSLVPIGDGLTMARKR